MTSDNRPDPTASNVAAGVAVRPDVQEREQVAALIYDHGAVWLRTADETPNSESWAAADRVLASDWLAGRARDAAAAALAPVQAELRSLRETAQGRHDHSMRLLQAGDFVDDGHQLRLSDAADQEMRLVEMLTALLATTGETTRG